MASPAPTAFVRHGEAKLGFAIFQILGRIVKFQYVSGNSGGVQSVFCASLARSESRRTTERKKLNVPRRKKRPGGNGDVYEALEDLFERARLWGTVGFADGAPPTLSEAVNLALDHLDWSQKDLRLRVNASSTQMSGWLKETPDRSIGSDDICRIAWALAGGLDHAVPLADSIELGEKGAGRGKLDVLLNGLLMLGGYASGLERSDIIWRNKLEAVSTPAGREAPPLIVGHLAWEPAKRAGYRDFAQELANSMATTLGVDPDHVVHKDLSFGDIEPRLRDRSVDFLAPYLMEFPARNTWYQAAPRPEGLELRIDGLVPSTHQTQLASALSENAVLGHLSLPDFVLVVARGEVADIFAKLVLPRVQKAPYSPGKEASKFVRSLLDEPLDQEGRVKLLLTNNVTCSAALLESPGKFCLLSDFLPDLRILKASFPLTFATHPLEYRLSDALDEAFVAVRRLGIYERLIQTYSDQNPHFQWFIASDALNRLARPSPRQPAT